MLFDWLVVGRVIEMNRAHAMRGRKQVVQEGKTPVTNEDEARLLFYSIASCGLLISPVLRKNFIRAEYSLGLCRGFAPSSVRSLRSQWPFATAPNLEPIAFLVEFLGMDD